VLNSPPICFYLILGRIIDRRFVIGGKYQASIEIPISEINVWKYPFGEVYLGEMKDPRGYFYPKGGITKRIRSSEYEFLICGGVMMRRYGP
jgi:hypothetical protein